jgi:hypothetical protein
VTVLLKVRIAAAEPPSARSAAPEQAVVLRQLEALASAV